MPIINLTDTTTLKKVGRQIPIAGKFWKGAPKENGRWGKDLDGEWRVEFNEEFKYAEDAFHALFPDTSQPIIVATYGNTKDDVLNDYYRLYGGNNVAKILCTGEHIKYSADNLTACKGCPLNPDAKDACSPSGYFRFQIPQLNKVLRQPIAFQFDVTSENELQQFAAELEYVFGKKGTLVNSLFILRRNDRTFNRDGQKNTKSLAYLVDFDVELDEKVKQYLALESGQPIENAPQLPSPKNDNPDAPIPDEELSQPAQQSQAEQRQKYIETVKEWMDRFFIDEESFLFLLGSFASIEQLIDRFPVQDELANHIVHELCVKHKKLVKIYGVRTMKHRNTVKMAIPFGMGLIYSFTRKDFGDYEEVARRGYGEPNKKGEYPHNIADCGNGTKDHAFQQVFGLPYMSMQLGLTDTGNLKIEAITGDIPF